MTEAKKKLCERCGKRPVGVGRRKYCDQCAREIMMEKDKPCGGAFDRAVKRIRDAEKAGLSISRCKHCFWRCGNGTCVWPAGMCDIQKGGNRK